MSLFIATLAYLFVPSLEVPDKPVLSSENAAIVIGLAQVRTQIFEPKV